MGSVAASRIASWKVRLPWVLLALGLAAGLAAATSQVHAQSAVNREAATELRPVAGSLDTPLRWRVEHGVWKQGACLSCLDGLRARLLPLRGAMASLRSSLEASVSLLIFSSAYGGAVARKGERARWRPSDATLPGPLGGLKGLGFSLGRATWAISRVSFSSVLLSLRLSV
jgi:hypothetical protein